MSGEPQNPTAATILIAEDELIVAEDLALTLRDLGYKVAGTASTGQLAIQLAEESKPDLILMDIRLRGEIDGIQASEQIRARFDIPIIFLTAYEKEDVLGRAKLTEPYGILAKPFSVYILQTTIETVLYKHAADKRVRESEERYRAVFDNVGVGVDLVDRDGRFVQVNNALISMLGYTEQDFYDLRFSDITHPDDKEISEQKLKSLMRGEISGYKLEKRYIRKDGSTMWGDLSVSAIRDANGEHVATIGVIVDVTDRKQADEALRRSEARRAKAEELAGLYSWEWDIRTGRLVRSAASYRIFGMRPEVIDLDIDRFVNTVHPDDRDRVRRALGEAVDGVRPYDIEFRTLLPDGQERVLHSRGEVQRDTKGRAVRVLGMTLDTTERKQVQERLRESEAQYRSIFENSAIGINLVDRDGGIIKVNQALLNILGYAEEELRQLTFLDVTHPEDREASRRNREALMADEIDSYRMVKRYVRRDGSIVWADLWSSPVRQANGKIAGTTSVLQDITDRKRAEELLQESERRYRAIFDGAAEGILAADLETRKLTFANPALCQMFGYTLEEIVQLNVNDIHPTESIQEVVAAFGAIGETEQLLVQNVPCVRKDGSVFYADIVGKPVVIEKREMNLGFFTDITDRKKAEEELYKLASIVRHTGELINLAALDGKMIFLNEAGCRMLGIDAADVGQHEIQEVIPEHLLPTVQLELLPALKADGIWEGELQYLNLKTGEITDVHAMCFVIRDSKTGSPICLANVSRDISERKQAEEALKESEEWYRSIVEEGFDGIFVQKGPKIVYANAVLHEMLGYSTGELEGIDHWLIYHPDHQKVFRERAIARMRGETLPHQFEVKLQRKDGSYFDGEINARAVTVKGEPGVRVWVKDVSRRKRLEVVQRRLATAIEQSADAIVIADVRGNVEYVNPAHERISGYSQEEVIGSRAPVLREQGLPAEVRQALSDSVTGGSAWSGRTVGRRKDGSLYDIDLKISPVRDLNGNVVNFVGLERDVTQEVRLQQQLLHAQKMEAIGTIAGGIAHDFNNLLTVVQGFSELLLAEKDQKHPDYADLQKIFHAATAGADLVQRLLLFSRKTEPKPVAMNLNEQIVEVEKLLRRTIPRMVDIHLDLSSRLPEINADPTQIEQVLINLAVNASDAMPEKGSITVRSRAVVLDEAYCRLHVGATPGDYVLLEVSDKGHGMDKQTVEHIFEPFFTTKEMGRGTGLGLAIVFGIVTQHNGHVTVSSEPGKGTTFKVYLPAIVAGPEPEVDSAGMMPAFGTETVLLVDDEEFVRELGARILTKHGYTVLQAENGREALDLFERERSGVSLVILDLIMPDMGGAECLMKLLKIDPQAKVLIASGYSADGSVRENVQVGARGFVTKPFRVKDLLREVRKVLDHN